jgi:hypothetical protein
MMTVGYVVFDLMLSGVSGVPIWLDPIADLMQWLLGLAALLTAVGTGLATARALGAVLAGIVALALTAPLPLERLLWGWTHGFGFQLISVIAGARWWVFEILMLVLAIVASRRVEPVADVPRVSRALRRSALALRLSVGCKAGFALFGVWLLACSSPLGSRGLTVLALACQIGTFSVLASALLAAARGRLADLPAWRLVVGGALALWVAGLVMVQAETLYVTLYRGMHIWLPLWMWGELANAAAVLCLLSALRAFARRRDLTYLATHASRQMTSFAALSLVAIGGLYWMVHHADASVGIVVLASVAALTQLVALLFVARLALNIAFAVERHSGAGLPLAKLVKTGGSP